LTDQLSGDFDYFILALAWEPDYCASSKKPDPQACMPGRRFGFIFHRLWPMYTQGWPSYCSTESMSNKLIAEIPVFYPTDFLHVHEWEKHGTYTGLDPQGYLLLSHELKESVVIPDKFTSPEEPFRMDADRLIEAFVKINPTFARNLFQYYVLVLDNS